MNKIDERTLSIVYKFKELVNEIDNKFFYVVMGGIAVDGYIERLTRNHLDVDMLIFRDDLDKAESILKNLGYRYKRFVHPKEPSLIYKMQTGGSDYLFSFQVADKVGNGKFEISFFRDSHMIFPLSCIKPRTILKLGEVEFPAISKEFLTKLKENEIVFFEKLKQEDPEKYQKKREQKHLNTLHDLELLKQ